MLFDMKGNNEVVGLIPNSLGKLKNLESLRLGVYDDCFDLFVINRDIF